MSVVYPSSIINSRLTVIDNAIDGGPANGFLRILDSSNNILSSIQFAKPSGTIAGGILSFNLLPLADQAAAFSGFASSARIEDSNGNVVVSGLTVGTVGTDIIIQNGVNTTFIAAGVTVALTAATITGH